jgi:hypothetical protein
VDSPQAENAQLSCAPHIIHSELIQSLSNLNFLLRIEEGVCELLSLSQGALYDLEPRDIAQKVANRLVGIPAAWVRILP